MTPAGMSPATYQRPGPRLLWSDEFNGAIDTTLNSANWNIEVGGNYASGTELQYYTARPENVSHDGAGNLRIVARSETYTGPDGTRSYTSARFQSQFKVLFGVGTRMEARIKIPTETGLLPQFWTIGAIAETIGWPAGGEIDLAELLSVTPRDVLYHLHGPTAGNPNVDTDASARYVHSEDVDLQYHVYGVDRYPDLISFSFDGQVKASLARSYYETRGGDWSPFLLDHFILMNLAVGNPWTGPPDGTTAWPVTMLVDWVRIWALPNRAPLRAASTLVDAFTTTFNTAEWTQTSGATAPAIDTGRLKLVTAAADTEYSKVTSNVGNPLNLVGSQIVIKVTQALAGSHESSIQVFKTGDPTTNVAFINAGNATLYMRSVTANVNSDTTIAYDATAHLYWRIRESGGNVLWDTSPDKTTWTNRRSMTAPAWVSSCYVVLGAGHWDAAEAAATTVYFDDLNTP